MRPLNEHQDTPKRSMLQRLARIGVIVLITAAIGWSVARQWDEVVEIFQRLSWPPVIAAVMAVLAGMGANVLAWRASLTDLGFRVDVATASRITLIGNLGKYLPGSVWSYVLQMELGRRAGLPRSRALLASMIATGLGMTAGLALALSGGLPAQSGSLGQFVKIVMWVVAPAALICAVPAIATRLINLALKALRRNPLEQALTWRGVTRTVGWSAVAWLCFGLQLWLLVNALTPTGFDGLLQCVVAIALAMVISTFAVFAPSGLGVREALLVAALTPFLASFAGDVERAAGLALGLALASRVVFTIADLVAAGLAALSAKRVLQVDTAVSPDVSYFP